MPPGRRRRILRVLLALMLGLIVLVLALPVWFPWLLRPIARAWGVQYSTYERTGYGRFRVSNVVAPVGTGELRARRVESNVPTGWFMQLKSHDQTGRAH